MNSAAAMCPAPSVIRNPLLAGASAIVLLCTPAGAAQSALPPIDDPLSALVNDYRANPGACKGSPAAAVGALDRAPALSRVRIGSGTFIESALARAGYAAEQAQAVYVTGPDNAAAAMTALQQSYCQVLLSERFGAIGSYREGTTWTVILARPAPPLPSVTYPDWRDAGQAMLDSVNTTRAQARSCGDRVFPAAPPLRWNQQLGQAALAHSSDMATRRYFDHQGADGSQAADRASRAGYAWRRIGENIAFGQHTPQDAVASWLGSPGHCANIMNPGFTEMGAAYGVTPQRAAGVIYWTQVFGMPR